MRLSDIARVCRANGITSYDDGKLKLTFGPAPSPKADKPTTQEAIEASRRTPPRPNLVDLMLRDDA